MTKERFDAIIKELVECGDIILSDWGLCDGLPYIAIEFEDFDGFDADGCGLGDRKYAVPDLVEELEDFFEETLDDGFYQEGVLFGTKYCVGYGSYNI